MESSNFNYYKQPFLVKVGLFISLIGQLWHMGSFKDVIQHIQYCIDTRIFKFMYKHSKWFRKRMMNKVKENGASPFFVFLIIQLLVGEMFNFEKTLSEDYIQQYIKLNELSVEDADKLRKSITEFKNKITHTDNEV